MTYIHVQYHIKHVLITKGFRQSIPPAPTAIIKVTKITAPIKYDIPKLISV